MLKLCSINAIGLSNLVKRKAFFLFCKEFKSDLMFIQETHSCPEDFWKTQWGGEMWLAHGSSHSGGVAILAHTFHGKCVWSKGDSKGHWLILLIDMNDCKFIVVNVYGYCSKDANTSLLGEIENYVNSTMRSHPNAKLIIGGDFNLVMNGSIDRFPPRVSLVTSCV